MKLYEFAFTRSIRARWTLQELGVDFEAITVNLRAGEHRSPAYLAINPAGKLPALVDGDLVLTESAAIVLYLGEKYGKFLPADARGRAEVNKWLLFTVTELEQPLWRIAKNRNLYPEAQRLAADIPLASQDFRAMAEVAELLGVGRSKVYQLLSQGSVPTVRLGGSVRVPAEALRQWIGQKATESTD